MRLSLLSMLLASLAPALVGGATASAQTSVVPGAHRDNDAGSTVGIAGFDRDARQQILVDDRLLRPTLLDRWIRGIAFRRDAQAPRAFVGGTTDLKVVLSIAPRAALDASETMDANHDPIVGNRIEVFRGLVTIPASSAPGGRTVSWANAEDVVDIAFTTPFRYTGGTLCVDLVGSRVAGSESPFWAVDAVSDPTQGLVARVGDACGPHGGRSDPSAAYATANVSPGELVAGFSAVFTARGKVGEIAALLFGVPVSIDLNALGIGAPGCRLYALGDLSIGAVFEDRSAYGRAGGVARVPVTIPVDPTFFGVSFRCQFAQLTFPVYTSNALDCTLAGALPGLGMSIVHGRSDGGVPPARGRVITTRGPVMQFRY